MSDAAVDRTVLRLRPDQAAEAGAMLARAFAADSMMVYLTPKAAVRHRRAARFMTAAVRYGLKNGEVDTTTGQVAGIAVWHPPGSTQMTVRRMLGTGMLTLPLRMGRSGLRPFIRFVQTAEGLHHRAMPGDHWYLQVLAVDPEHQGRGVGGALLRRGLARADAAGLPSYLETLNAANLPFYRRHGFEVVGEADVTDGPRIWAMRREPASV